MLVAAIGLVIGAVAGYRHWRRKSPDEIERLRRLDVNRRGRIIQGRIIDLVEPSTPAPPRRLLVFTYDVGGVTYQAAQDVSALPAVASNAPGLVGQPASIKYDPRQPTNSILACEDWCGVHLKDKAQGASAPREAPASNG